jgi:hypothetical protein
VTGEGRGLCGEVCVRLEGTGGSKSAFLQAMCPISRLCEAVGADLILPAYSRASVDVM